MGVATRRPKGGEWVPRGGDALSFFYYSGHGAANGKGDDYLIPVDVKEINLGGSWYSAVRLDELINRLKDGAPDAKHFVVFDACRNTLRLKDTGSKSLSQPKGFQPVAYIPGGMLIAFATAPGELASDRGGAAGPYADALAEEIVKPHIEAITIFRNVQLKLQSSIGQEPWFQSGPMAAVYFSGAEPPTPQSPSTGPASQSPPSTRPVAVEVAQRWAEVKESKSIAVLNAFRAEYGKIDIVYDTYAAQKIVELGQSLLDESHNAKDIDTFERLMNTSILSNDWIYARLLFEINRLLVSEYYALDPLFKAQKLGADGAVKYNLRQLEIKFISTAIANILRSPRPTDTEVDLHSVAVWNANLRNVDLRNSNLTDASFFYDDMRGVDLAGATLTNTGFAQVDMQGADLKEIYDFDYSSFSGTAWWQVPHASRELLEYLTKRYPFDAKVDYGAHTTTTKQDFDQSLARLFGSAESRLSGSCPPTLSWDEKVKCEQR